MFYYNTDEKHTMISTSHQHFFSLKLHKKRASLFGLGSRWSCLTSKRLCRKEWGNRLHLECSHMTSAVVFVPTRFLTLSSSFTKTKMMDDNKSS